MRNKTVFSVIFLTVFIIIYSCGNKGGTGPTDPCGAVTITVSGTVTNTTGPGQSNGSIAASATGATGLTFNINGGPFQSSGNFTGLAAGTYTIFARNGGGCAGSATFTVNNGDPCTSVSFTVGGNAVNATPCLATPNGSVTIITSGGGSGFTYNLNNGAFQASATFSNLVAGNYTVGAKEAGGCVRTASVSVNPSPPGALFASVKTIINANCTTSGCHSGSIPAGGIDFTVDCNIVINAARIKVRAVDGFNTANQMPPPPNPGLSAADRTAITNWVNAGGGYTN